MNEERLKVLKMLKEGRITMEEAELLLDALGEGQSAQGGEREPGSGDRGPTEGGRSRGGWGGIPEGLFNFDWGSGSRIFETGFRDALKGFEERLRDVAKDLGARDLPNQFKEYFGRSSGQVSRDLEIPVTGVDRIVITNRWGDIRVSGGEREEIVGTAAITAWAKDPDSATELAGQVEISHYRENETLFVQCELQDSLKAARFRADLDLTLPADRGLVLKGMSGDHSVSGLDRGVEISNLSGDIIVQRSNGIMSLETKSGDIEVLGCEGELSAQTLSGDIDMEGLRSVRVAAKSVSGDIRGALTPAGGVELGTTSGDIHLRFPADAALTLEAETTSGRISCRLPVEQAEEPGRRFRAELNGGGSEVRLSSRSGDISISE